MLYRFHRCVLDVSRRELHVDGQQRPVEPQVFDVLVHLIERRDHVVSKADLIDAVWKGRIVSDETLSSRINAARRAVDDDGKTQAIIRTVPRRGFRFVADVSGDAGDPLLLTAVSALSGTAEGDECAPSQTIRFCRTHDGVQLAFATAGAGSPLIKAANWLNHLEYDWVSPVFRDVFAEFARHFLLLRYDARGTGLSDWDVPTISFEQFVQDLEVVVEASSMKRFALLGISQGAAVAIEFAARHPERVSHLVIWDGFARGRRRRQSQEENERSDAYLTLMRQGWGQSNSAFLRMFASLYLPDGKPEHIDWFTNLQRIATSAENAVRIRQAIDEIDVSHRLDLIRAPTLVLHSRDEAVVPLDEARYIASRIAGARFVLLNSSNHFVLPHEPERRRALDEIRRFLCGSDQRGEE